MKEQACCKNCARYIKGYCSLKGKQPEHHSCARWQKKYGQ
jgi:hypothetical protein